MARDRNAGFTLPNQQLVRHIRGRDTLRREVPNGSRRSIRRLARMFRPGASFIALLLTSISPLTPRTDVGVPPGDPIIGRWDITIRTPDGERPSWLELEPSGRGIVVGRFVGIVGSARPISHVMVQSDSFHFAIPPQWENGDADLVVDGRLTDGRLAGTMLFPDGKRFDWSGVRAPALRREH